MALNKNNPNARGVKQQDKTYNGKPIKPVLYVGNWVGQGKFMAAQTEDGKIIKMDVKVGDRVLFGKWSGTEVKIDGKEYSIMKESDIMGVSKGK